METSLFSYYVASSKTSSNQTINIYTIPYVLYINTATKL
uniref:Uncharacterized protein n=1 Tax=Arundo donax TaxID=35708 RepID=A0A0A8ZVB5_ARUDO